MTSITTEEIQHAFLEISKRSKELRKRDCEVKSRLADKQVITFYCNGYVSNKENSHDESDNESNEETYQGRYLLYNRFIENKNKIEGLSLNNPDEIVLQLNDVDIYFNNPMSP
jgi:hypothetical protein